MNSSIPDIILQETKEFSDDLLKEVLDFVLFLKSKSQRLDTEITDIEALSSFQKDELAHLEDEFKNYKALYPNE